MVKSDKTAKRGDTCRAEGMHFVFSLFFPFSFPFPPLFFSRKPKIGLLSLPETLLLLASTSPKKDGESGQSP